MANLSIKAETEAYDEFGADALDHLPFKQRFKLAPHRDLQGEAKKLKMSPKLPMDAFVKTEETDGDIQGVLVGRSAYNVDVINHHNDQDWKEQGHSCDRQNSTVRNDSHGIAKDNSSPNSKPLSFDSSTSEIAKLSCMDAQYPQNGRDSQESPSTKPSDFIKTQENGDKCLLAMPIGYIPPVGQEFVPSDANNMHVSALPTTIADVKVETMESGSESQCENTMGILLGKANMVAVKGEIVTWEESCEEVIDHMPLRQRKELLFARSAFKLDSSRNLKCSRKNLPSAFECNPNFSETGKPEGRIQRRKRKKSATDSVETALEEDAPGLLKVLVDKGVMVDEIKLYGADTESEDALDVPPEDDSFGDLEAVVSKLFFQRSSILKFAPLHSTKLAKPSYCLACLLSLVEQTRYLQFREWPVEWGWCRDLQSFIFVFERHNRIVLERPEYGYATYFFELVDSLPIDWQIKRLVTAMKLTSCSRTTLIENKSLSVGEDLTEGEARVLEEYGWAPNTGLGSMLNYCDRVVHDKKNEEDISEWRSKIGKLLMNGLDGGTIILANLPKKFKGYKHSQDSAYHVKAL